MIRNLFMAGLLLGSPVGSLTTSLINGPVVSKANSIVTNYQPEGDFGYSDIEVATSEICNNDYVVDGSGCVSGELTDYGYDLSKFTFNIFTNNQLINLADNVVTNSVYLYIYRTNVSKVYDRVSISQSDNASNDIFEEYPIKPLSISADGHYVKYKVEGINVKEQQTRRYMVRYLYIEATHDKLEDYFYIDGNEEDKNTDSFNEFVIKDDEIQKRGKDLLVVTDKVVFFDIVPEQGTGYVDTGKAKQLNFVFFNTDNDSYFEKNGAKLIEARVKWEDLSSRGFIRAKDGYYLNNGMLPSSWTVPIDEPLSYRPLESYDDFENYLLGEEDYEVTIPRYRNYFGPYPNTPEMWDKHNELIKGETLEVDNGNWGSSDTFMWDTLGEVKYLDTNKEADEDLVSKYKWYINYSNYDIMLDRLHVKNLHNNQEYDAMGIDGLRWTKDLNIESLSFLLSDNTIRNFITVDTYTDSIGYKDFLNKNEADGFPTWLVILISAIFGVLGLIVLLVCFPVLMPVLGVVLKYGAKVVFVLIKCVLWVPYSILVLPFQAISAKRNGEKLEVWNPFK